jgi:hypothetical protein
MLESGMDVKNGFLDENKKVGGYINTILSISPIQTYFFILI